MLPCRLTSRERRDFEYKRTVYQLAREHEKVGECDALLPLVGEGVMGTDGRETLFHSMGV